MVGYNPSFSSEDNAGLSNMSHDLSRLRVQTLSFCSSRRLDVFSAQRSILLIFFLIIGMNPHISMLPWSLSLVYYSLNLKMNASVNEKANSYCIYIFSTGPGGDWPRVFFFLLVSWLWCSSFISMIHLLSYQYYNFPFYYHLRQFTIDSCQTLYNISHPS